ncbi:Protein translocase subunit SecE [Thermoflexales bacterium]|nr:Protein translocase subunit SecE [Thermoflexales bacterium]
MSEVKPENRFKRYFKETRAEVRKVHWPTRKEARSLTTVVLVITIVMTIFLGIVSGLASTLATGFFVQQNTLAIAGVAIAAVAGIIVLAVVLRRQ